MAEQFIAVVLEERIVRQAQDGSKAVWRLMSTFDGVGEWQAYHISANGDILHSMERLPLPGADSMIVNFGEVVTYH